MILKKYPDDLFVARQYVKSLLVFSNGSEAAVKLVLEQFQIKPFLDKAREANQAYLIEKHGYSKYQRNVNFMELSLCSYYLTNEEFGRLVRKYLSRSIDPSTQIRARNLMLERLDALSDIDGKLRHLRIISDLLEGDKYKTVKYGE